MENKEFFPESDPKVFESAEEFVAYAEENGIELTDEQLAQVAGGAAWDKSKSAGDCPFCGSSNTEMRYNEAGPGSSRSSWYGWCKSCERGWVGGGI